MDQTNVGAEEGQVPPEQLEKLVDWAERGAAENMKGKQENRAALVKEANVALAIALAGISGTAAYAVRLLEPDGRTPAAVGAAALCLYLMACVLVLLWGSLATVGYPPVFNDPRNLLRVELLREGYTVTQLRQVEIDEFHKRVVDAWTLNERTARWLNRVRYAMTVSPLVFLLCALVWKRWG